MIENEECFAIWAPDDVLWSQWAKPVLFASVPLLETEHLPAVAPIDAPGVPEAWGGSAVVIDLPGAQSVAVGLAMAGRGFRPVPLFNGTIGPSAVVDVRELVDALGAGSQVLREMTIRPDARPAFLLDANRKGTTVGLTDGMYDNRWVVLPQDLPSATFLQTHGIREVIVMARGTLEPAMDLVHALLRWQEGGLRLGIVDLAGKRFEANLHVAKPSLFRRAWYGAVALSGLRRSNVGGFGSTVPEQTSGGGFFG